MEDERSLTKEEMDNVSGGGDIPYGIIDLTPPPEEPSNQSKCPFCKSADLRANMWYQDGTVRYTCRSCGRNFISMR